MMLPDWLGLGGDGLLLNRCPEGSIFHMSNFEPLRAR